MTSANSNSSLRSENSVFPALESPFYLLCVIFNLLYFFGRRPKGGRAWPKWPNGKFAYEAKLRHSGSDAYSAELVLLNKKQILGGGACLHCYL